MAEAFISDELAAVKAPMAYRTAEMLQVDSDATVTVAIETLSVLTETEDDAETENDASFVMLADTAIVEDEAAVNSPNV
jgi:hypothetical protein